MGRPVSISDAAVYAVVRELASTGVPVTPARVRKRLIERHGVGGGAERIDTLTKAALQNLADVNLHHESIPPELARLGGQFMVDLMKIASQHADAAAAARYAALEVDLNRYRDEARQRVLDLENSNAGLRGQITQLTERTHSLEQSLTKQGELNVALRSDCETAQRLLESERQSHQRAHQALVDQLTQAQHQLLTERGRSTLALSDDDAQRVAEAFARVVQKESGS